MTAALGLMMNSLALPTPTDFQPIVQQLFVLGSILLQLEKVGVSTLDTGSQISWCLMMARSVACEEKGKSLRDLVASRTNKVLLHSKM